MKTEIPQTGFYFDGVLTKLVVFDRVRGCPLTYALSVRKNFTAQAEEKPSTVPVHVRRNGTRLLKKGNNKKEAVSIRNVRSVARKNMFILARFLRRAECIALLPVVMPTHHFGMLFAEKKITHGKGEDFYFQGMFMSKALTIPIKTLADMLLNIGSSWKSTLDAFLQKMRKSTIKMVSRPITALAI